MSTAMQIAERVYSLAHEQNDAALMIGADRVLACTLYFSGDFEAARQYAKHAVQIWRSGSVQSYAEEYYTPIVGCLVYLAISEWHLGESTSCHRVMAEAISLAKELNDANALVYALCWAAILAANEQNLAEVNR